MATEKGLFGGETFVEDKAVAVGIKRYDELIKKEAILDELLKKNDVLVMLTMKYKEEK
jgi:hypothetical protein